MSTDTGKARIVLIGDGTTTLSALESLAEAFNLAALVRSADDEVTDRARELGVTTVTGMRFSELQSVLGRFEPDLVVVSSFSRLIPARVLNRWPFVNVHYANLPEYRGRANVNWALINGEPATGITVHSMVPGLDAGGVLGQESVAIGPRDTVGDLYNTLNAVQRRILPMAVTRRLAGDLGDPQDEDRATYGCSRNPSDGYVDWNLPTLAIDRLIRALAPPFPGAFTYFERRRLGIVKAEPVDSPRRYVGRVPGRVVYVDREGGAVDVLTADGVLRVQEVEVDGSTHPASKIVRSVRATLGLTPGDLVELFELLVSELRSHARDGERL